MLKVCRAYPRSPLAEVATDANAWVAVVTHGPVSPLTFSTNPRPRRACMQANSGSFLPHLGRSPQSSGHFLLSKGESSAGLVRSRAGRGPEHTPNPAVGVTYLC